MRACEGCRRRKIKCDAATTNTWPCSACIRLKLQCVRPNGQYEDSPGDGQGFEPIEFEAAQLQGNYGQMAVQPQSIPGQAKQSAYHAPVQYDQELYSPGGYGDLSVSQQNLQYTTVSPSLGVMDQPYASANMFPTPPMHNQPTPSVSSPDSYQQDSYPQQDLSDLLGALKVDERGTGESLRPRMSHCVLLLLTLPHQRPI